MKSRVREIADVGFKAKSTQKIGTKTFVEGQPVLYIDTATTSTIEGAATPVYAQGGKGNTRLISWEGEKTLTFTVEDALLSPIGFSILSGAGLFKGNKTVTEVNVHATTATTMTVEDDDITINLTDALAEGESICEHAPIFVVITESDGSVTGDMLKKLSLNVSEEDKTVTLTGSKADQDEDMQALIESGKSVFVDYYVVKKAADVSELSIDAENFAGYYYVEGSTLFRRQSDGVDLPAEITFPNVKIQSNFTFTMSSTGDPSTFTFTMDAMPGYTYFNKTNKVLCVIQVVEDGAEATKDQIPYMPHNGGAEAAQLDNDSVPSPEKSI